MFRPTVALLLALSLAVPFTAPTPAIAKDGKNAAAAAGLMLGLALKAAIEENRRQSPQQRWDTVGDRSFRPADMPGVICYARAQECYRNNHYSASATRAVFG